MGSAAESLEDKSIKTKNWKWSQYVKTYQNNQNKDTTNQIVLVTIAILEVLLSFSNPFFLRYQTSMIQYKFLKIFVNCSTKKCRSNYCVLN